MGLILKNINGGFGRLRLSGGTGRMNVLAATSSTPPSPTVDPDAQAFITAAAITNPTQQNAINTLVVSLKSYGVWSKMKAMYPFIGGTAFSHKFNLKNPLDTDAAFRLVFNGGWVHSATGAKLNGTNAYADTKLNTLVQGLTTANAHISFYGRTSSTTSDGAEIGNYDGGTPGGLVIQGRSSSGFNRYFYNLYNAAGITVATPPKGLILGSSVLSSRRDLYVNGTSIANNTTNDTMTMLNLNLYIGAANSNNSAISPSDAELALTSIGDGLTNTEVANFYTAVQAFQTTLGRQV